MSEPTSNELAEIFRLREKFMRTLRTRKPTEYPTWPIDLSDKKNQQHVRDMALRGVEEMFEALGHLKNWKPHRSTEIKEIEVETAV